jgi:hypothetical protein
LGKWEFYVIYTYLWQIFASNPNNPKEEGRDLPNEGQKMGAIAPAPENARKKN